MKEEKYVKEEKIEIPEELIRNPYKYICDVVEEILPHTGRKAFKIISLMPCSLILPDLIYKGKTIRSNINVLFLTPPSGGKSTVSEFLSQISYSPISLRSITAAKLESKIHSNPFFTLIVEEYATMSKNPIVGKIIEGVLGEEKRVQRATMRGEIDDVTEGIGLLCGTPVDLQEHLSGGLIFRLIPLIIFHDIEEHSSIGKDIAGGIGKDNKFELKEQYIKNYYDELLKIQSGGNSKIEQIMGYEIPENFSKEAYNEWDKMTRNIYKRIKAPFNWFRSLHEFFRVLVSHAFLNVFNRKVEKGILYPNDEDFKVALKIMRDDLKIKYRLINTDLFIRSISTLKELSQIMDSEKISDEQKNILKSLIKIKKGKVFRE